MPKVNLSLLAYLARTDIQRRHAGTVGGMAWAVVAPIALVGAIWFALDIGLGMRSKVGPGYGIGLVIGIVAWMAFADVVGDSTSSVVRNPHLVKKVFFPVEFLPLSSVVSAYVIHLALLLFICAVVFATGHFSPSRFWTLPFFMIVSLVTSTGIALLVSSLNVLVRDTAAIAPVLTTIWFWLTPIVWPLSQVPENWQSVVALNPMALVVEGYRSAITGSALPFGIQSIGISMAVSLLLLTGGSLLFRSLRPAFGDAL
jgi:lipopolysaccharide transport system permease protein